MQFNNFPPYSTVRFLGSTAYIRIIKDLLLKSIDKIEKIILNLADPRLYRNEIKIKLAITTLNEILLYEGYEIFLENNKPIIKDKIIESKNNLNKKGNFMNIDSNIIVNILNIVIGKKNINEKPIPNNIHNQHIDYILSNELAEGEIISDEGGKKYILDAIITPKGKNYLNAMEIKSKYNLDYTIYENAFKKNENEIKSIEIKNAFLSYKSQNRSEANNIYKTLKNSYIKVTFDEKDLNYTDDIIKFEESIRTHDYALLLISDEYLKSTDCMYEVVNLLKEKEYKNKILPIIFQIEKFDDDYKLRIIEYWENKKNELEAKLNQKNLNIISDFSAELKKNNHIFQNIGNFIDTIKNMRYITYENGLKSDFKEIKDIILS